MGSAFYCAHRQAARQVLLDQDHEDQDRHEGDERNEGDCVVDDAVRAAGEFASATDIV